MTCQSKSPRVFKISRHLIPPLLSGILRKSETLPLSLELTLTVISVHLTNQHSFSMIEHVQDPEENPSSPDQPNPTKSFKDKLWEIVFEAETPMGKFFDVALLWLIGASVLAVMLETVQAVNFKYGKALLIAEWVFTVIFTIEYLVRIWLVRRPLRYMLSFYGIVDLLSCLPSYITLAFGGGTHYAVIRLLRLLRMFRVLKMVRSRPGSRNHFTWTCRIPCKNHGILLRHAHLCHDCGNSHLHC